MSEKEGEKFLNLLKTDFSMKANLTENEPKLIKYWDEENIYKKILKKNKDGEVKILHDGPPYANGHIHIGHALNKILKDFVCKYHYMRGYHSPYVPGWDCHGLPIELMVRKEEKTQDLVEFRKKCREYAEKFIGVQRDEFKRLGILGDWDDPYKTMSFDYEADILKAFSEIYKKGYINKGRKPIHWCMSCETALAEAEVEYNDHTSPSIFVKFKVNGHKDLYIVIWTTTPWTLPANLAVSLHPNFVYSRVRVDKEEWIVAKELLKQSMTEMEINEYELLEDKLGSAFEGMTYRHPLLEKNCPVILGEHVTLEQGTGCVHTAPGHGQEDFEMGKKYGLEIFSPVDDKGKYTDEYAEMKGESVFHANPVIVEKLGAKGLLIKEKKITHSYPHCWRCHNPLVFRATPQWFIDTLEQNIKNSVLEATAKTGWIPGWGEVRFANMVENRTDWCISRQRSWGVPIPSLICKSCGEEFVDTAFTEQLVERIRKESSDIWFVRELDELAAGKLECPKCKSADIAKGKNILDVWFDSGVSWFAVLEGKMKESVPCEMYLEGTDQYRGWFQSSMWPSVIMRGAAPYKKVLTHGFSLDETGRPMSKSLGNVISPLEVVKKYGAEILRLWVASIDYTEDFRFSYNVLNQMTDAYKNIRNRLRFILMNLADFDPEKDVVPYAEMENLDKWAMKALHDFAASIDDAYDKYEYHRVYHGLIEFLTVTLSALYFDMIKSRLYMNPPRSRKRRSAQTAMHYILTVLLQRISPVLSFTAEETFRFLYKDKESVFLDKWFNIPAEWGEGNEKYKEAFDLRDIVLKELENRRAEKAIGLSLDAAVTIKYKKEEFKDVLELFDLKEFLIVSGVSTLCDPSMQEETRIEVTKSPGEKCTRCWNYRTDLKKGLCSDCAEQIKNWSKEDI